MTTPKTSALERGLIRVLDRLFETECIKHDGTPVLYRWIIMRLGSRGRVYIHHFVMSDGREMHDHPKPFTTIGLKGGYRRSERGAGTPRPHPSHGVPGPVAPAVSASPHPPGDPRARQDMLDSGDSRRKEPTLGILRTEGAGTLA